jgi:precorrin-3B synthase
VSAPSSTRRPGPDACPGVRSVWAALDGGLARVRLPGGYLSAEGLRVLADAAEELGTGLLELTLRGNVQLRGLRPGGEHDLAARLERAALLPSAAHDRVRNILASPLTGLVSERDVAPLVADLDDGLCADPVLAGLPGRFLFAVDDGSVDVAELGADVTLLVAGPSVALLLGGAEVGIRVAPAAAAAAALQSAHGFLEERAAQCSPAWRLVELAHGPARVAARVRARVVVAADGAPLPARASGVPAPPRLGGHAMRDGAVALVVGVPDGRLNVAAARALLAAADPDVGLRITPWRSVMLPGLAVAAVAATAEALVRHGLCVA